MMTEASHATADAAAASTPMSGIGRLSLSFEAETIDVHRPLRTWIRGEPSGPGRLARHAVPRLPVCGFALARAGPSRLRALRGSSRRTVHDADIRQLSVLAQPSDALCVGCRIRCGVPGDP